MAISITPSPFGSVTVTLDGELGGTLAVSVLATSNSVLNMDLGVPGPQGEQGEPGSNGQGVAAGGLTNQVLVKLSNDDFDTGWANAGTGDYLPLTGGTMSGAILFDAIGGQNISKGSFDSGRGGYNGISLNCANLYELNWQSGYLKNVYNNAVAPINVESDFIFPVDVNGNDSEIGPWGFGVENTTLIQTAYVEPAEISITSSTSNTLITAGNITIAGNIPEVGTATGVISGVATYWEGGSNGTFNLSYAGVNGNTPDNIGDGNWSVSKDGVSGYNGDGWGLAPDKVFSTKNTGWSFGDDGITFASDGSVQITAGLPLTGGTMTGGLTMEAILFLTDNPIILNGEGAGIQFSDGSNQATAFPGYTGTSAQYIDGTGALETFPPVGDRYFTTSNSTLTCDSGNGKTMTIGTGLSYSRQQDITVSYDNSNHMHGTVLTYDSATGVLTWDSNTHSGGGTYSSWEVNVGGVAGAVLPVGGTTGQVLAKINSTNFNTEWISLGSMALATATDYLAKAGNLSGLASTSTARTNLGLGSASTLASSAVVQTANNLSDVTASTARTNLGLGAVATDAYATTAQAQAGTSTTTVVNPSTLLDAKYFQGGRFLNQSTWSNATSGTGATANTQYNNARILTAPTSTTGSANWYQNLCNNVRGQEWYAGFDFSKRCVFGGRFCKNVGTTDTASVFRYSVGGSGSIGDLSVRGIMIKQTGSAALQLLVHNGTTLTTVTSSFTPVNLAAYDVVVTSDGSGNCVLYVNGSSVATTTGGPTSSQGINYIRTQLEVQNTSAITSGAMSYVFSDIFLQNNL